MFCGFGCIVCADKFPFLSFQDSPLSDICMTSDWRPCQTISEGCICWKFGFQLKRRNFLQFFRRILPPSNIVCWKPSLSSFTNTSHLIKHYSLPFHIWPYIPGMEHVMIHHGIMVPEIHQIHKPLQIYNVCWTMSSIHCKFQWTFPNVVTWGFYF